MTRGDNPIPSFDKTLQTTHRWLNELKFVAALDNEDQAYSVLRVVLHALRDRMPVDEAVQFGAQLPMLVRGFYYDGWKPSATPKRHRTVEAFAASLQPFPMKDSGLSPEKALRSVFLMLDHRISDGELADVRATLPEELRALWPRQ
jgi:uncharacterized protein (DUF2267 family)